MKKNSLIIIFAMLMFNSVCLKAQSKLGHAADYVASLEPHSQPNFMFPEIENFDGSYQFIVKQKKDFLLTTETFSIIEAKRLDNEDVTISLNEFLDVYVVSREKVKQSRFVPFKTSYILK